MRHLVVRWIAVLTCVVAFPAAAQRTTGVIGQYTPPRSWPQEPRRFDLLHQRIELRFDVPHRAIMGVVTTKVAITLAPTDTIRLNAENLTIDRATDARGQVLRFTQDTARVTVRLARRAAVGDTVEFTLQYHGVPERGLYIVPRRNVIWSQGEATETRAWVPTYDASNDKTTWEFLVTVDSNMKVLSNGRLVGVTPANGGAQNVWHWSQEKPASTYLYSVVAGPFTILHDQWRGIPVEYYTYADTVNAAWRTFGETPAMIELYSQVLGVNFPWDKYDQSIIPDFTYGGMENVSATTQTDLALHSAASEPGNSGRGPQRARAGAPVVRRPHDHGRLGRHLVERGHHHLHGVGAGGEDARLGRRRRELVQPAAGGDAGRPERGPVTRLGEVPGYRSDLPLLLGPRLSQGRPAGAPAPPPPRRFDVLGRDEALPDRQRPTSR